MTAGARHPGADRQLRKCEWSRTLNEEGGAQSVFSHFINSDKRDPDVQFVSERDQHRPATPAERIPVYQIEVETK